jgi:hypothetical protein
MANDADRAAKRARRKRDPHDMREERGAKVIKIVLEADVRPGARKCHPPKYDAAGRGRGRFEADWRDVAKYPIPQA